jgi:hypothetical protein
MPRTRDLFLFISIGGFLVLAIGATVVGSIQTNNTSKADQIVVPTVGEEVEYSAEVYEPSEPSREERLALMREKIAAGSELQIEAVEKEEIVVEAGPEPEEATPPPAPATTTPETPLISEPILCPTYSTYSQFWPLGEVKVEVAEGARLVYQEVIHEYESDPLTATSSNTLPSEVGKSVLLQLPIRLNPAATPNCLQSDVVGIAKDGSLIRNGEVGLYGIFGAETLIGYAFDGFPIYGTSPEQGDTCGGMMVAGQYRYHLSADRETVLNCFSAPPVRLP